MYPGSEQQESALNCVESLAAQYPGIPIEAVFKKDLLRRGMAWSREALDAYMSHGASPRFTTWCPGPLGVLGKDQEGARLEYHVRLLRFYRDTRARYRLPAPPGYREPGLGRALFSVSSFMDALPAASPN